MRKNDLKELRQDTIPALQKKVETLRREIAMMSLEAVTNAPKDSNVSRRKMRDLAQILTIIKEKQLYDKTT